jgi:anthranilate synthase component I
VRRQSCVVYACMLTMCKSQGLYHTALRTQARSCILVASSPEILCRVDKKRQVTNRPLAGTRKRGATPEEDAWLEADLLSDSKECAEHIMLVDLGRNDVGRVAEAGSVAVTRLMDIERYSHVMHISSTVKGAP